MKKEQKIQSFEWHDIPFKNLIKILELKKKL